MAEEGRAAEEDEAALMTGAGADGVVLVKGAGEDAGTNEQYCCKIAV